MNVALTRARNHLFIIGKCSNLCTDETWSKVIQICQGKLDDFSHHRIHTYMLYFSVISEISKGKH